MFLSFLYLRCFSTLLTFSGRVMVTVSIVVVGAILSGEGPRLVLFGLPQSGVCKEEAEN